jgi:hypothetical protein
MHIGGIEEVTPVPTESTRGKPEVYIFELIFL